jgi:hypothetical protein
VSFRGRLGSPVNPGITTERSVVVAAHYTGRVRQTTTFRPHVGCVPGGGGSSPPPYIAALRLAAPEAFPPGRPTVRRVRTAPLGAGSRRVGVACGASERLVAASHAIGFHTQVTPAAAIVAAVRSSRLVRGRRVLVTVGVAPVARNAEAVVQVQAVCSGAGR